MRWRIRLQPFVDEEMVCLESGAWKAVEKSAKYSSAHSRQTPQVRHGTELRRIRELSVGRPLFLEDRERFQVCSAPRSSVLFAPSMPYALGLVELCSKPFTKLATKCSGDQSRDGLGQ